MRILFLVGRLAEDIGQDDAVERGRAVVERSDLDRRDQLGEQVVEGEPEDLELETALEAKKCNKTRKRTRKGCERVGKGVRRKEERRDLGEQVVEGDRCPV